MDSNNQVGPVYDGEKPTPNQMKSIIIDLVRDARCLHPSDLLRLERENFSFFSKSLPILDEFLVTSLGAGRSVESVLRGKFKTCKAGLPVFLRNFFLKIFTRSGALRPLCKSVVRYIRFLRTVLNFVKKYRVPFSVQEVDEQCKKQVAIETENESTSLLLSSGSEPHWVPGARSLVKWLVGKFSSTSGGALQTFGPGCTADTNSSTAAKLRESCRPGTGYRCFFGPSYQPIASRGKYSLVKSGHALAERNRLESLSDLDRDRSIPSRGILVPKDSRGARFIAAEPAPLSWIQQQQFKRLAARIHSRTEYCTRYGWSLGISVTDQTVNQRLAKSASLGSHATLDLSSASDRITFAIVRKLFPLDWAMVLSLCQTKTIVLPDKTVLEKHRFASMGSACTFPVLAIVCWSVSLAAAYYDKHLTNSNPSNVLAWASREGHMGVFGDDIVVPRGWTESVVKAITYCGLKINEGKSFTEGMFAESCGHDYVTGKLVSPIRCKLNPLLRNSLMSTCSLASQLRHFRAHRAADRLYKAAFSIATRLGASIPFSKVSRGYATLYPIGKSRSALTYMCTAVPKLKVIENVSHKFDVPEDFVDYYSFAYGCSSQEIRKYSYLIKPVLREVGSAYLMDGTAVSFDTVAVDSIEIRLEKSGQFMLVPKYNKYSKDTGLQPVRTSHLERAFGRVVNGVPLVFSSFFSRLDRDVKDFILDSITRLQSQPALRLGGEEKGEKVLNLNL